MATAANDAAWGEALDPEADGLILEGRRRSSVGLASRDRLTSIAFGGSYLATAVLLLVTSTASRHPAVLVYVLFVALYAVAARVSFEVGACWVLPTQLVLVPMLFVLPVAAVPLCMTAGLMLAHQYRQSFDRVLLVLASSWHTIGPVLVLLSAPAGDRGPSWEDWPLYLAAFGAQLVLDAGTGSLREWIGLGVSPRSQVQTIAWISVVDGALAPVGLLIAFAASEHVLLVLLGLPLIGLLKLFSREREQRVDHALQLGQAYRGTAFLLGDVVEADDAYTGEHSRDVVALTLAVCDRLRLGRRERRDAEFVALLHDVGKIRVPGEIINKPGPLDADERQVIETHTLIGEEMLGRVGGLLGEVGHIVRSCHERWDGSGYPDGLAGRQIPLIARIVCATDAFSAMTTDRPYRVARPVEEALAELRRCAGTQFDPAVVEAICGLTEA